MVNDHALASQTCNAEVGDKTAGENFWWRSTQLNDAAGPAAIAGYLQVLADFWAVAATRWPSLAVTDHGACDLALTAYANAMASNLEPIGDG